MILLDWTTVREDSYVIYHPGNKEMVRLNSKGSVTYAHEKTAKANLTRRIRELKKYIAEYADDLAKMFHPGFTNRRLAELNAQLVILEECYVVKVDETKLI